MSRNKQKQIKRKLDRFNRIYNDYCKLVDDAVANPDKYKGKLSVEDANKAKEDFKRKYAEAIRQTQGRKGFTSAFARFLAKTSAWESGVQNKIVNIIKKVIPTNIDDAILETGMKLNNLTVDGAINLLNKIADNTDRSQFDEEVNKETANLIEHNHPSWYLRFKGDNLAPLNYYDSVDEYVEFTNDNSVKQLTPLIVRIPIQLVLPNEDEYLSRLNQAFTANLTSLLNARGYGYTDYDSKDVANFMMNTRFATAVLALAIRTAKVYSNYNTLNIMEPDMLIAAHNTGYYTKTNIQNERNILVSLKERIRLSIQSLKTLTAGAAPLYDRTLFLLSNFFKDSKSKKSCLYVFDLDMDDEDGYFAINYHIGNSTTLQTDVYTGTNLYSITNLLDTFDDILNKCFVQDFKAKQIRSDINFLYGVTGSTQYTSYFEGAYKSIDEPLKFVDDENVKLQIHNMICVPRMTNKHAQSGNHASYSYFDGTVPTNSYFITPISFGSQVGTSTNKSFNPLYTKINAWKKLSADNLVSATRLYTYDDRSINVAVTDDPNNQGVLAVKFVNGTTHLKCGKFEIPTCIQVITYNNLFNGTNAQFSTLTIAGPGNVLIPTVYDSTDKFVDYYRDFALWTWSYADWMPHVKINLTADTFTSKGDDPNVYWNTNYRIMHDLDMCANISKQQLNPIDSVALLSELIWSQNNNDIIDKEHAKQAKSNKESKKEKKDKRDK